MEEVMTRTLEEAHDRVDEIAKIEAGWLQSIRDNTARGEPVDVVAVVVTKTLLSMLNAEGVKMPAIYPNPLNCKDASGIELEWDVGFNAGIMTTIHPNGTFESLYVDQTVLFANDEEHTTSDIVECARWLTEKLG